MSDVHVVAIMAAILRTNPNGDGIGNHACVQDCIEEASEILEKTKIFETGSSDD